MPGGPNPQLSQRAGKAFKALPIFRLSGPQRFALVERINQAENFDALSAADRDLIVEAELFLALPFYEQQAQWDEFDRRPAQPA